jgi:hypothetical protein
MMKKIERLPPAFHRLQEVGGVLEFAVFEEAEGTQDEIVAAILSALSQIATVDPEALRSVGYRRITERAFFGDWYEPDAGALIKLGDWQTDAGEELHSPRLNDLEHRRIVSGGGSIPKAGAGGQFAYAFTEPPYGLRAPPSEVQALFDQICSFMMPPKSEVHVLDWSSDRLPDVSDYFADGMEWWGVFLFSVHVPALKRLTIVAGSSTD